MGRKMQEEMLTLEKFEEASEIVKKVTLETKLVYSDYFSAQTGNRVYFENRVFFLFLRLLRCFSSPGSLRTPMDSVYGD